MTPVPADQCPHVCCPETDAPHEHRVDPEACEDCKAINDPQQPLRTQGRYLVDKAHRVASKRHPEAFPQPKEDS